MPRDDRPSATQNYERAPGECRKNAESAARVFLEKRARERNCNKTFALFLVVQDERKERAAAAARIKSNCCPFKSNR